MSSKPAPLAGLKVLEMGTLIAGPFCTRLLAEFGAEVIKIEAPGEGDPLRNWRKLHKGTSLWWLVQARNKKSVTVNLRHADGQEIVRRLAQGCDIVVENFRPGVTWNDIVTSADIVEFNYLKPGFFAIFQQWNTGADNISVTSIPEPATVSLTGLIGAALIARRRR